MGALPPVSNGAGNSQPFLAVMGANPSQSVGNLMEKDLLRLILESRLAEISGERDASISMTALAKPSLGVVPGE